MERKTSVEDPENFLHCALGNGKKHWFMAAVAGWLRP